jgi:hypothetical protein
MAERLPTRCQLRVTQRRRVVAYAYDVGMRRAARHFGLARRTEADVLPTLDGGRRRRSGPSIRTVRAPQHGAKFNLAVEAGASSTGTSNCRMAWPSRPAGAASNRPRLFVPRCRWRRRFICGRDVARRELGRVARGRPQFSQTT